MVATWTAEFEKDSTLGLIEECYDNLKSKGALHKLARRATTEFCTQATSSKLPTSPHLPMLTTMSDVVRRKSCNASSNCPCMTKAAANSGSPTRSPHLAAQGVREPRTPVKRLPPSHLVPLVRPLVLLQVPLSSPVMADMFPPPRHRRYPGCPPLLTRFLLRRPSLALLPQVRHRYPRILRTVAYRSLPGFVRYTRSSRRNRVSWPLRRGISSKW